MQTGIKTIGTLNWRAEQYAVYRSLFPDPLTVLHRAFGLVLLIGTLRFMARGWIETFYLIPQFHFSFVSWARPLPAVGMWAVFVGMAIAAMCIMVGWRTKWALATFFLLFTYVELLDKTYYLNHYYLVSCLCFLLFWLPNNPHAILLTRCYLVLVYFFAGIAKLNADWLLHAQPLRIWLPANAHLPIIGWLLDYTWVAYLFSWGGALFDLTIGFFLCNKRTRPYAFAALVIFHLLTGWLFQIGMFPFIMIACALVFFDWNMLASESVLSKRLKSTWMFREIQFPKHAPTKCELISSRLLSLLGNVVRGAYSQMSTYRVNSIVPSQHIATIVISLFFIAQIVVPLRHIAYAGDVNWTGAGERFAWRVMVVDKAGMAFFELTERETGRQFSADPHAYLTPQQVMQMSFQPDMLVQFAHFLGEKYNAEVRVEAYVSINGRSSRLLLDPTVDLTQE